MVFEVTRNIGGKRVVEEVEAADRTELWKLLKARKIDPISVSESPDGEKRRSPSPMRGALAGIVVIAIGGLCFWYMSNKGASKAIESSPVEDEKPIVEVKPDIRTNAVVKPVPAPKPKKLGPQRVGEVRNGRRLLPDGTLMRVSKHVVTSGVDAVSIVDKTFKRWTDRRIADTLDMEPGEMLVGGSDAYFKNFARDFRASLAEPIEYDKNDDQYVKELKIGVQQLREELKQRMDGGEDITMLMIDFRQQMQELGLYRNELRQQVVELTQDDNLSQEDYDTMIEAANKLLEARGSKPLELPTAVKARIRLTATRLAAEQKASAND